MILLKDGEVVTSGPFSQVKNHEEYKNYSSHTKKKEENESQKESENPFGDIEDPIRKMSRKESELFLERKVSKTYQTDDIEKIKEEIAQFRDSINKKDEEEKDQKDKGKLTKKENKESGIVGIWVIVQYFYYYNPFLFVLTIISYGLFIGIRTWIEFWLVYWT